MRGLDLPSKLYTVNQRKVIERTDIRVGNLIFSSANLLSSCIGARGTRFLVVADSVGIKRGSDAISDIRTRFGILPDIDFDVGRVLAIVPVGFLNDLRSLSASRKCNFFLCSEDVYSIVIAKIMVSANENKLVG